MRRFSGWLVTGMLWAIRAQGAAAPIDDYAALPLMQAPELSPDGRRFASVMSTDGQQHLIVGPSPGVDGKPQKMALPADMDVRNWQWVNDDWLLLTMSSSYKLEGKVFRISRAYGLRASDAALVPIARDIAAQNGADVLWIARDGSPRGPDRDPAIDLHQP
jgi:hypothetical protein